MFLLTRPTVPRGRLCYFFTVKMKKLKVNIRPSISFRSTQTFHVAGLVGISGTFLIVSTSFCRCNCEWFWAELTRNVYSCSYYSFELMSSMFRWFVRCNTSKRYHPAVPLENSAFKISSTRMMLNSEYISYILCKISHLQQSTTII